MRNSLMPQRDSKISIVVWEGKEELCRAFVVEGSLKTPGFSLQPYTKWAVSKYC